MAGITYSVLAAEVLKLRKRWLPYAIFFVMIGGVAIQIWLAGYVAWEESQDINSQDFALGLSARRTFTLPWSLTALLDTGQFWGAILIGVLAASSVATEYAWGTVRLALVRGQPRHKFLIAKLSGIALIATLMLLLALATGIWFSIMATAIAGLPITLDVPGGPSLLDIVMMVLRAAYAVLPYALLAFCLAVVARSTTLGVVGIVLYMFVESVIIAILGATGDTTSDMRTLIIGHNVNSLLAVNRITGFDGYNSFSPRDRPSPLELPDPWVAALVVAAYCVLFLVIAFWLFRRRDVQVSHA